MMEHEDRTMEKREECLFEEVALLEVLKENQEENYRKILQGIRRRERMRTFLKAFVSCAAVALIFFVINSRFSSELESMPQVYDVPVLITDSGEEVLLGNENSYTLEYPAIGDEQMKENGDAVEKVIGHVGATVPPVVQKNTVVIPDGFTYNIKFDDGTEAYINSGSYVEYPQSFANKDVRRASITGEGYFKVAKSEKPFIVEAMGVEITVYGTEFNVNTNKGNRVETLLVSGEVGVKGSDMENEIILVPNEMLVYDLESRVADTRVVDPQDYLGWMRGDFSCTDQSLSEFMEELGGHYGISIECTAAASDKQVTINLSRKLGFRQMMEILSVAFNVEFEKLDNGKYICREKF